MGFINPITKSYLFNKIVLVISNKKTNISELLLKYIENAFSNGFGSMI